MYNYVNSCYQIISGVHHLLLLLLFSFLFDILAGFDQVVLGDLVYSKVECAEKVTTSFNSESEDNSCDNTYDCSQLDEISETALPEEINNSVKVWCLSSHWLHTVGLFINSNLVMLASALSY